MTLVGVKRQILGLSMEGEIDDEVVERAMEGHRDELKELDDAIDNDEATLDGDQDAESATEGQQREEADEDYHSDHDANAPSKKHRTQATKQPRQSLVSKKPRRTSPEDSPKRKRRKTKSIKDDSDDEWQPGGL